MKTYLKETKKIFKPVVSQISEKGKGRDDLLEAAFFAYAHKNPLIDLIFWGRLASVEKYILEDGAKKVLDFGCGSGVMSFALGKSNLNVIATDNEPRPFQEIRRFIDFPPSVKFLDPGTLHQAVYQNSFDTIIALDVLEHMDTLNPFMEFSRQLLKPGGKIIVSGPTENFLYKIGRKLAQKAGFLMLQKT